MKSGSNGDWFVAGLTTGVVSVLALAEIIWVARYYYKRRKPTPPPVPVLGDDVRAELLEIRSRVAEARSAAAENHRAAMELLRRHIDSHPAPGR